MAPARPSASAPAEPSLLDAQDLALLRAAAEHRFVLAAQLTDVTGRSPAATQRRLVRLRSAGLLRSERPLRHEPTAFSATRAGLAAAGSDLRVSPRVDLAAYRHDVGLGWLHVAARRGLFGELSGIVTEKRMRSEDRRADRPDGAPVHGVRLGYGEGPRRHYPDLVLTTGSGHRVAMELELTTKSPRRRERILAAYAADPRIDAVVYLVPTRVAGEAIRRSAARAGARDLVQVQRFEWAGGRPPGEAGRAATRPAPRRPAPATSRSREESGR